MQSTCYLIECKFLDIDILFRLMKLKKGLKTLILKIISYFEAIHSFRFSQLLDYILEKQQFFRNARIFIFLKQNDFSGSLLISWSRVSVSDRGL